MNKLIATAAAACLALSGAAHAGSISVSAFEIDAFQSAVDYTNFDVEDFENAGPAGQVGSSLVTDVGTFTSLGGTGTGGVCTESGGNQDCTQLYLKDTDTFGQGSLVATGNDYDDSPGDWSLNANDTLGIIWEVTRIGGEMFNRIVFAVTDLTDTGANVTISATESDDLTFNSKEFGNGNEKLFVIDFGTLISKATVTIANSKVNDSFSLDGASVGVVPLPAGGLLLLTGFGALALRRRRKAA